MAPRNLQRTYNLLCLLLQSNFGLLREPCAAQAFLSEHYLMCYCWLGVWCAGFLFCLTTGSES